MRNEIQWPAEGIAGDLISVEIEEVIRTVVRKRAGVDGDPVRHVTYLHTPAGERIARLDPEAQVIWR